MKPVVETFLACSKDEDSLTLDGRNVLVMEFLDKLSRHLPEAVTAAVQDHIYNEKVLNDVYLHYVHRQRRLQFRFENETDSTRRFLFVEYTFEEVGE